MSDPEWCVTELLMKLKGKKADNLCGSQAQRESLEQDLEVPWSFRANPSAYGAVQHVLMSGKTGLRHHSTEESSQSLLYV